MNLKLYFSFKALFPIIFYALIALLTFIFEKHLRKIFSRKIKEKLLLESFILIGISFLLFVFGIYLSNFCNIDLYREILKNTGAFLSSIYLARATRLIRNINLKEEKKNYAPYIFFTLAYIFSLLSLFPLKSKIILNIFIKLKKLFIFSGIFSLLWELRYIFSKDLFQKIYKFSIFSISFIFLILWETNYLEFNLKTLIGLSLIIFLTVLYVLFYTKGINIVLHFLEKELPKRDIDTIEYHLKILITIIYFLLSIKIFSSFSNFYIILNKLDKIYILKSELIKVSLGNLIKAIFTAIILFNILNIGKKLIKLVFPKNMREVEGGSAEALIFNIGILFNLMVILSTLGITWKVILPIAGTLGVGLGFGLQTIMNNYISGFILLFSKKLKVGDIVELPSVSVSTLGSETSSVFGKVEDIGILSTIVRTNDGVEISIPNSSFINSPIVNFSYKDPYVRLKIPIGVAYSSDPITVKKILEEVILSLPQVAKHLPILVRFEEMGDSALIFKAIFWIDIRKNLWIRNIISDFYFKAWYKLKEAGIEIPFPQNDIWFRNNLKVEIENFKNFKDNKK